MKLKPIARTGTTPARKRFWDAVFNAVVASQKTGGRNVSVDEHPGKGTLINVANSQTRRNPHAGGEPPPTPGQVCFDIAFSATLSGTAIMSGDTCAECSPIAVSASIDGPGIAYCCTSGEPVLGGCSDCDCIFNEQAVEKTVAECGGLCIAPPNNFDGYVELDNVSGDYHLLVRGNIATNFGNEPDCAGVCSIGLDSINTYDLGSDPVGTHTIDFTGDVTAATFHFVIVITAP